jgi:hypothetical protein
VKKTREVSSAGTVQLCDATVVSPFSKERRQESERERERERSTEWALAWTVTSVCGKAMSKMEE